MPAGQGVPVPPPPPRATANGQNVEAVSRCCSVQPMGAWGHSSGGLGANSCGVAIPLGALYAATMAC